MPRIVRPTNSVVPTTANIYCKVVITDDNSVDYTLMDTYSGLEADNFLLEGSITKVATDRLNSFQIKIHNDQGNFTDKFDGGEVVRIYMDKTDATTLVYYGKVDNVKYGVNVNNGFYMDLDGRTYPELIDKTITGMEVASRVDEALCGIFYNHYSDITLQFWNGTAWATATYNSSSDTVSWDLPVTTLPTTLMNMNYQNKKGLSVIKEIVKRADMDCYVWYDQDNTRWAFRIFNENSIKNDDVNVSYGNNVISVGDYGTTNDDIYNRVIMYGKQESDNILLLKTKNDTASQSNLWIKDSIQTDSSLTTMEEIGDKATYEIGQGVITTASGNMTILCAPKLNPGDNITISIPYCDISGYYKIKEFTHKFGPLFTTSIQLSKRTKTVSDLFVSKVDAEEFVTPISNPNNMKDSYTIYFNEDPTKMASLSDCEETDGKLQLSTDKTTGVAQAISITMGYNVLSCELRRYSNLLTDSDVYEVTNDGGTTWETYDITSGDIHTFSSVGSEFDFRITMNRTLAADTSPMYEAICALTK